jgi:peptidyl-prolyl cis-trans isomerase SurA
MMKIVFKFFIATCFLLCVCSAISAQTLFTYGNQSVSKDEFLKAYRKNNTDKSTTEQAYRDYLELYMRYKLKVKAAYDLKLDTASGQAAEMQNFRNQVVDTYMNDDESLNKIINEAFARSQKDIHLAHIFISIPKNATPADTLKAFQKATDAYNELKKGKQFGDVASLYSDDPSAKNNHGDIGFITVFSLPYDLETLAYTTPEGKFSKIYRSKNGYHLFKNAEERKAIGRIKTAQILFLFPPNAGDAAKAAIKQKADSVYTLLINGANFSELAKKYSGDNLSFQTGGEMVEFGVGKYDPAFETAAYALNKDSAISKPVLTSFGYHIIKRLIRKPVPLVNNKETFEAYKQRVLADPRNEYAKKALLQKILVETNFRRSPIDENNLSVYTDSFLQHKNLPRFAGIDEKTVLFSFTKKNSTVKDWLAYVKTAKDMRRVNDGKTNKELLEQFLQAAAFENYRNHLEDYNKDFAYQLNEFREGNLLFEIMQRKIWDKASSDSVGLKNYFESHQNKYWWEASADAVLFTSGNEKAASDVKKKIEQRNINAWRKIVDSSAGAAQADSGRFELIQLPLPAEKTFTAGQFTSMNSNQNDNTVTFAYIVKVYTDRSPRNYNDARGFVINDYQTYLEDSWIAELKKKYPVKIDEAVLKSLPK